MSESVKEREKGGYRWLLRTLIIHDDKWTERRGKSQKGEEGEKGGDGTHRGRLVVRPGSGIWPQVAGGAWAPEGPVGDRAGEGQGARGLRG